MTVDQRAALAIAEWAQSPDNRASLVHQPCTLTELATLMPLVSAGARLHLANLAGLASISDAGWALACSTVAARARSDERPPADPHRLIGDHSRSRSHLRLVPSPDEARTARQAAVAANPFHGLPRF